MSEKEAVYRRDGQWWRWVETENHAREYGPFQTKKAAKRALLEPRRRKVRLALQGGPASSDEQGRIMDQFTELFNRHSAPEMELAEAVATMLNAGITQIRMAKHFRRQQSWFSHMTSIATFPELLKAYLRSGKVKATTLIEATRAFGVERIEQALREIDAQHRREGNLGKISAREIFEYLGDPQPRYYYRSARDRRRAGNE